MKTYPTRASVLPVIPARVSVIVGGCSATVTVEEGRSLANDILDACAEAEALNPPSRVTRVRAWLGR